MDYEQYKVSVPEGKSGDWEISHFTVEDNDWRALQYGYRAPKPGTYTRLMRRGDWDPWMSDTNAEVEDHREVIRKLERATPNSHVLIHGLGLGMVLQVALRNVNIEHIDVVELEQDVIKLVAPHYMKRTQNGRLTIHHGNALTYPWPTNSHWHVVWHDIWQSLCVDDLNEHTKLNRKFAKRADWQGCWAHELLLDLRRWN